MSFSISRYTPADAGEWNAFAAQSKNATFLLNRGYMDYHADRFTDFSLMAHDARGHLAAMLPANARDGTLQSHGGLTFGGWITPYRGYDIVAAMEIHAAACEFLRREGFSEVVYKPIPYIYTETPAQEDLFVLFRAGARRTASMVSSAIALATDAGPDKGKRREARIALRRGLRVAESDRLDLFWPILTDVLATRHCVNPVHTLAEIRLLQSRFPANIRFFGVFDNDGTLVGGTVMYLDRGVAHAQYISASEAGREGHALALLFCRLISRFRAEGYRWFDFGVSSENGGAYLNEGLAHQKSTFGGRAVVYDTYRFSLTD